MTFDFELRDLERFKMGFLGGRGLSVSRSQRGGALQTNLVFLLRVDARSAQGVTSLDLLDHERCACQLPFMTVLFTYQSASNTCKYPENIGAREQQRVERRPHLSFAVSFARVCAISHQIVAIGSGVNFILSNPFFSFL